MLLKHELYFNLIFASKIYHLIDLVFPKKILTFAIQQGFIFLNYLKKNPN